MRVCRQFSFWRSVIVLIGLLLYLQAVQATCRLSAIRVSASDAEPRVILEFNQVVRYHLDQNATHLILNVEDCLISKHAAHFKKTNNLRAMTITRKNKALVQLVFIWRHPVGPVEDTLLKAQRRQPVRLVLDVSFSKKSTSSNNAKKTEKKVAVNITPSHFRSVVVMLDPGHGGHDPGAIADNGVKEKNVTLAIARQLADRINAVPGMEAILTRKSDYYVGLRQRLRLARRAKSDVFISIHADAARSSHAKGASIYRLSDRGASNERIRWLAEKENRAELLGGVDLSEKSNQLRSVLLDLSQAHTKQSSAAIADLILQSISQVTKLHYKRVERAGFVVLKSPDIPSILIETGFVSNPYEAARLNHPAHQQKLANAILAGLKSYLSLRPPAKTWFAWRKQTTQYRIARGDTLSTIAARYDVDLQDLKSANQLSSARIYVGQSLLIPPAES